MELCFIQVSTQYSSVVICVVCIGVMTCNISFTATVYVVRKIRASVKDGEQTEQPVLTPCSLAKGEFILIDIFM